MMSHEVLKIIIARYIEEPLDFLNIRLTCKTNDQFCNNIDITKFLTQIAEGNILCYKTKKGKLHGKFIEFYEPNPTLKHLKMFKNKPEQKKIKKIAFYNNGVLHGVTTTFFESGKVHSKTVFVNGLEEGNYREFDSFDNLKKKIEYRRGILDGLHRIWRYGLLQREHFFRDGKRVSIIIENQIDFEAEERHKETLESDEEIYEEFQ